MLLRPGELGAPSLARLALGFSGCLGLSCAVGCATGSLGATDADLARGQASTSEGATFYAGECARCHGRRGQGIADTPPVFGPGALPEFPRENATTGVPGVQDPQQAEIEQRTRRTGAASRGPFRNAWDLYAFVSVHRGFRFKTPAAKAAHDWALVTFLMATNGAAIPGVGITPDNASTVTIPRK
jgi:hypothetical protein